MALYIEEGPPTPEDQPVWTLRLPDRPCVDCLLAGKQNECTHMVRVFVPLDEWERREEEPTPPTPDVGWIGTHKSKYGKPFTVKLVHGGRFAAISSAGDQLFTGEFSDDYTWEPPPVEEPDPESAYQIVRRHLADAKATEFFQPLLAELTAAVGVPEPDPQPIRWLTAHANFVGDIYTHETEQAAMAERHLSGRIVYPVMPAGWKPREENDA